MTRPTVLRRSARGLAAGATLLLVAACAPSSPPQPPLNPASCVRTVRTISPAPTRAGTGPRVAANGTIGVYQVNDGTGPALPVSFGLFSASYNIYRYDGVAETTTRLTPLGTTSINPEVSADGSVVVFATVTDPNSPPANLGIDVWSAATNTITRITGNATGRSVEPVVSGDGRYVAFVSDATTLIPGDPDVNSNFDLFVFDRTTATMRRLTDQTSHWMTAAGLFGPSTLRISQDGSTIILARVRDDNHGDLLSIDRASGAITTIVDLVESPTPNPDPMAGPIPPIILSGDPSADGSVVSFTTGTIVPGITPDPNGAFDVFVWNRVGGHITQITATPLVLPIGSGPISLTTAVSGNGRYVSFASNLADPSDHITDPPVLLAPTTIATYLFDRYTSTYTSVAPFLGYDASANAGAIVGTAGNDIKASICS